MNILEQKFRYVPAARTNLRRTFERVRRELKEQAEAQAKVRNVRQIELVREVKTRKGRA